MTDVWVGVVVTIPEPHATILQNWRRRVGDPQADQIVPHVTLLPPTSIALDLVPVVTAHLSDAAKAVDPFLMHLFGTGTFRPISPVVFIQVARGVADCELLESAIRGGPLGRDLDYPYHPHVTVAQGVPESSLDEAYDGLSGFIARFAVDRIHLHQRGADGRWTPLQEFGLGST